MERKLEEMNAELQQVSARLQRLHATISGLKKDMTELKTFFYEELGEPDNFEAAMDVLAAEQQTYHQAQRTDVCVCVALRHNRKAVYQERKERRKQLYGKLEQRKAKLRHHQSLAATCEGKKQQPETDDGLNIHATVAALEESVRQSRAARSKQRRRIPKIA